jgi:hypothetical protein
MAVPTVFLVHGCNIVSTINNVIQQVDISTVVGTFVVGETITGGTSLSTAKVNAVYSSYLLLTNLSADFQSGETISGAAASATTTSVNYDATDDYGIPLIINATQTGVVCRFVGFSGGLTMGSSGEIAEKKPAVLFSPSINVYVGDQITGTSTGYTSTYTVQSVKPVYEATQANVYMYKAFVEAVD